MSHTDYSETEDFYSQGFERRGVLSIWVSSRPILGRTTTDVLQDLCGVGYYNLDDQESNARTEEVPLEVLLAEISYSGSFISEAIKSAIFRQVKSARWVVVQFDFASDPSRVSRPISSDPLFLGVFSYAAA
jgi:hypothetical protein